MKATIDLSRELTPEELKSFQDQAKAAQRSVDDHLKALLFGDRELHQPAQLTGEPGSNRAEVKGDR